MVTASKTIEEEQDYQRAAAARWEAVEGMLDTHPEYRARLGATDADPEGVAMRLLRELIAQPYPASESEDGRLAISFAAAVHKLVEKHALWKGTDRPIPDEDKLALDILKVVLRYPPPPPFTAPEAPPAGFVTVHVPEFAEPEIRAMALIEVAMRPLGTDAQGRVARWAFDRYSEPDER